MKTIRPGTNIIDYQPDDDENTFYIAYSASLSEIIERLKEKWGDDISMSSIEIESQNIQTTCLGYCGDRYDPSDYANFIKVTRII